MTVLFEAAPIASLIVFLQVSLHPTVQHSTGGGSTLTTVNPSGTGSGLPQSTSAQTCGVGGKTVVLVKSVPFVAFVELDVGGLVLLVGLGAGGFVVFVVPSVPLVVLAGLGGPLGAGLGTVELVALLVGIGFVVDGFVGTTLVLLACKSLDS
jgi:hypothetical protein